MTPHKLMRFIITWEV